MSRSKDKGTRFETAVCDYLRWALDDERIQRLTLHGAADQGDIGNVYWHGHRVVIECKNTRRLAYSTAWGETLVEMGNADTDLGLLVMHRPNVGFDTTEGVGRQLAVTELKMFDRFKDGSPENIASVMDALRETVPRNDLLVGLPLAVMALCLNYGQTLGPDNTKEEVSYGR